MKRIPISAAQAIAENYGYDQVIVVARAVGDAGGEHVTTYGRDKAHCDVAARIGDFLKYKIMGWVKEQREAPRLTEKAQREIEGDFDNTREAFILLDLIAAEFASDPMSVQCFDLRIVQRVKDSVAKRKAFVKRNPIYSD